MPITVLSVTPTADGAGADEEDEEEEEEEDEEDAPEEEAMAAGEGARARTRRAAAAAPRRGGRAGAFSFLSLRDWFGQRTQRPRLLSHPAYDRPRRRCVHEQESERGAPATKAP